MDNMRALVIQYHATFFILFSLLIFNSCIYYISCFITLFKKKVPYFQYSLKKLITFFNLQFYSRV